MTWKYHIHPSIGVARLGNSKAGFYLGPETVGGLPIDCDANGNPIMENGAPKPVSAFKDAAGAIKRQAQKFKIFRGDGHAGHEITVNDDDIDRIEWTVHIANKKPIWFTFSELQGNLEFGPENSYENQHITRNNPDVTDETDRQKLIIDPGPRSIKTPGDTVEFSRFNIPEHYKHGSFPPADAGGQTIDSLGELRMDDAGNLIALGGNGAVTGSATISSFRGAAGYWDDIADGFVTATIYMKSGAAEVAEPGWLIIGSPKYAPELVNITTLYDTAWDIAVRFMQADIRLFTGEDNAKEFDQHNGYTPLKGFNPDYEVHFETQIKPIVDRIAGYRWVADIPYLANFAMPGFDLSDPSDANKANREAYFAKFRVPVLPADYHEWIHKVPNGPNQLFSDGLEGVPLMPLNSGDNSVTNEGPIYKFETLSPTQYFLMYQWAKGKMRDTPITTPSASSQMDEASIGNCVGAPFSPGIETTWIVRNRPIYDKPLRLKLAHFNGFIVSDMMSYYRENGLSTTADEAEGQGCEPGDMTKRMAIPWQADFAECTVQMPNITLPNVNQLGDGTGIEVPPAYYVYWWPPQSPMHVVTGSIDPGEQVIDAFVSQIDGQPVIPAGQRVSYQRGIADIAGMIQDWSFLGFVVNQGTDAYPYFVEKERDTQFFGQTTFQQQSTKG